MTDACPIKVAGQKQRVAIAGALVSQPKLLLLDELTTFIDEADQERVVQSVRNVVASDRDVTALWVTHRSVLKKE